MQLVVALLAAAGGGAFVWYLATLRRCLTLVRPRNRRMAPADVWLNLIPGFNLYWGFVTARRVAASVAEEYANREESPAPVDFGRSAGETGVLCAGLAGGAAAGWAAGGPDVLAGAAALLAVPTAVLWLLHWSAVDAFARELAVPVMEEADDFPADG